MRFVTHDGVELHCLIWNGPDGGGRDAAQAGPSETAGDDAPAPLILLHGGGANAHWWDHLAVELALDRPVLALDFRGHGDSAHPEERRVGAFGDDLEALLGRLGREDVHLIGHSLGAAVALDHAARFHATRSLVLVDLARGSRPGSGRRARLALSLRRSYRSREEAVERFRFLPESEHASEALRREIAEHSVREEPDGRFGYKFDPGWFGLPSRPRPEPADVRCPVLLVRGMDSQLLSRTGARALVADLPDGRLVEIPSAGHHVLLDQPERLLEAIAGFAPLRRIG